MRLALSHVRLFLDKMGGNLKRNENQMSPNCAIKQKSVNLGWLGPCTLDIFWTNSASTQTRDEGKKTNAGEANRDFVHV